MRCLVLSTVLCAVTAVVAAGAPGAGRAPVFKLYTEQPGIYRVSHQELVDAGLDPRSWPSAAIGLSNLGRQVPLGVEDGGDGQFGPGDEVVFIGQWLRGEYSFLDEYSRHNCYVLDFDDPQPMRFRDQPEREWDPEVAATRARLESSFHLENDRIRVRFVPTQRGEEELWYWARIGDRDRKPFLVDFHLDQLDRQGGRAVHLKVAFRSWSLVFDRAIEGIPEHRVELTLNGVPAGVAEWTGTGHHHLEIDVPATNCREGENTIAVRVPPRKSPRNGERLADVVLLNWLEVSYPRLPAIADRQARLGVVGGAKDAPVVLFSVARRPLEVLTPGGWRVVFQRPTGPRLVFNLPPGEAECLVSSPGAMRRAQRVVKDRPSRLRSSQHRADYIMVAHATLMDAVRPLVELHRKRGLEVELVDVEDVYDEFNHGLLHPRSIRDFLRHAFHSWQPPAPRFVLLVGDSSWDFKNPDADNGRYADWAYSPQEKWGFVKNRCALYADRAGLNHRNMVPTWSYTTHQGPAASDSMLTCVDGDDDLPDMAVGRFPVVLAEEVAAIVAKTVAAASAGQSGPWRRRLLLIADDETRYQEESDITAAQAQDRGLEPVKVYPAVGSASNDSFTQRILETFDGGVAMVHFIGMGGAYIWRTRPDQVKKGRELDLVSLDDLDRLARSARLPVVLSLTCYSAPFDHPNADSIGEKLLRLPERGAVAVVAASWRDSPSPHLGRAFISELGRPGSTVGEALLEAKRQTATPEQLHTYNLLGDPALPATVAPQFVDLEVDEGRDGLTVRGRADIGGLEGRVLVEVVGEGQRIVAAREIELSGGAFAVGFSPDEMADGATTAGVRAYLWDPSSRRVGVGWVSLNEPDPAAE